MKIGGLEKFSLIDYPDHVAAVVFTVGCTFRCPFCYNPALINPMLVPKYGKSENRSLSDQNFEQGQFSLIEEDGLFHFLETRVGKLDGVVVTGGEPTMHSDLPAFLLKIKNLGFHVKLDTNGSNPEMLKKVLSEKLVDYLAMDIKSDKSGYEKSVGLNVDFGKIEESVKIIKESGLPYEFRTTCVPGFIDGNAVIEMGKMIQGAMAWYLQRFKSDSEMLDHSLENKNSFTDDEMGELTSFGKKFVENCQFRG